MEKKFYYEMLKKHFLKRNDIGFFIQTTLQSVEKQLVIIEGAGHNTVAS
jgi:hypothetical protein